MIILDNISPRLKQSFELQKHNMIIQVSFTSIVFALVCISTISFSLHIEATGGFFNIGDSFIFISAILFGPFIGGIGGGLGATFADIFLGYYDFAPITFLIKTLEGLLVGIIYNHLKRKLFRSSSKKKLHFSIVIGGFLISFFSIVYRSFEWFIILGIGINFALIILPFFLNKEHLLKLFSMLLGGFWMVLAYFLTEFFILDLKELALIEIPFNLFQISLGTCIALPITIKLKQYEFLIKTPEDLKKEQEISQRTHKFNSLALFAGGIAHDFNNFLGILLGNISLLKLEFQDNSEISEMLGEMDNATKNASKLTNQLLNFSKDKSILTSSESISAVLKESANFVLHGSSIVLNYQIQKDLYDVDINREKISQVISNIIINAKQAMSNNTKQKIWIHAKNIDYDQKSKFGLKPGRYVKIEIIDSGSGIKEENFIKIFDPYFTTKKEGSGLGLFNCQTIIQEHRGVIVAANELGKGAKFVIFLPATSEQ